MSRVDDIMNNSMEAEEFLSQLDSAIEEIDQLKEKTIQQAFTVEQKIIENAELKEENERLKKELNSMFWRNEWMKAQEALKFYADEKNHDDAKRHCECCLDTPIDIDQGEKARQALIGHE